MAKILVADNHSSARRAIALVLRANGYEVEEAVNGEIAFHALEKGGFDLGVIDLDMHPTDGDELIEDVRAQLWGRRIPFILYTGRPKSEQRIKDVLEIYDQVHYYQKPGNLAEFRELVKKVLAGE
jgi:CheY-like chemotaxis protein